MKATRASRSFYDDSTLEETEFALAISPCPQIEGAHDIGGRTETPRERSGLDHPRRVPSPRQTALHEQDVSETLTLAWALGLAFAVALTVYLSHG